MTQTAPRSGTGDTSRPGLSAEQLEALRGMLEQQRRFRLDQLAELQAGDPSGPLCDKDRHIADSLTTGARTALRDVVEALQRMDDGRYGSCRLCGSPLEIERLEVLPQVGLCMGCQRSEQGG